MEEERCESIVGSQQEAVGSHARHPADCLLLTADFLLAVPDARTHAALFTSDLAAAGAAAAGSHRQISLLNAYP